MASGNSMVTIDKIYLETLLRRAQFHTSEHSDGTPSDDSEKIVISKKKHDALTQSVREYENLRRNLYKGGILEETLNILIKDDTLSENGGCEDGGGENGGCENGGCENGGCENGGCENGGCENGTSTIPATHEDHDNSTAFMTQIPSPSAQDTNGHQAYTFGTPRNSSSLFPRRSQDYQGSQSHSFQYQQSPNNLHTDGYDDHPNSPDGIDTFDFETGDNSRTRPQRPTYEKFAQRTVLLFNLPDGTTYADICDAVRGGMLLDIYLRTHEHTASVSFLEQAHAKEFLRHVKRNDLYIRSKRVDIRWSDRQFILPNHIANKVGMGATRNLIIRNCNPKNTEKVIRDDLEHIHNFVIIKVAFNGSNAFISTNSLHNAMFARTCMMSRGTYKNSKIEWDNDECAAPLARRPNSQSDNPPHSRKKAPLVNRFQLLNIDREDGSESDTEGMGVPAMRTTSQARLVTENG